MIMPTLPELTFRPPLLVFCIPPDAELKTEGRAVRGGRPTRRASAVTGTSLGLAAQPDV
jgi:hypothetical protein